jgi:hypothetical protein
LASRGRSYCHARNWTANIREPVMRSPLTVTRILAVIVVSISLAAPVAASGILELRIELTPSASAQRTGSGSRIVALRSRSVRPGTLRRERRPELGPDQLVIAVFDGNGTQIDWRTMADPRVVRIEAPDANGLLTGQRIVEDSLSFTLRIPDLPGAARVRLYNTEATETGYTLALIGEVGLPR